MKAGWDQQDYINMPKHIPLSIPAKYSYCIVEQNVGSISTGYKHHKEYHSKIKCQQCKSVVLLRNSRIKEYFNNYNGPYICGCCGGGKGICFMLTDQEIKEAKNTYLTSDITWEKLAEKYNIPLGRIYKLCDGNILTKVRRYNKIRNKLLDHEANFIKLQQNHIEKKKVELAKYESLVKQVLEGNKAEKYNVG